MKKMNWMIVGLALLTAAGSMAGEISRVADLQEFADNKRSGNSHASHAPDAAWSYLLVNEYGKFHSSKTDRTDWGKALNSSQAQPLNQSGPARPGSKSGRSSGRRTARRLKRSATTRKRITCGSTGTRTAKIPHRRSGGPLSSRSSRFRKRDAIPFRANSSMSSTPERR